MTTAPAKPQILEERTLNFAVSVIDFTNQLPKNVENKIISQQLIRSASSIGANYTEANNASSKQDFRNKIFIAKKEASETRYWLRLADKVNRGTDITKLVDEVSQLILILQKIISTLKSSSA